MKLPPQLPQEGKQTMSDSIPKFSSILNNSPARRKGLGETAATSQIEQREELAKIKLVEPGPELRPESQVPVQGESPADLLRKPSKKALRMPFSTKADPRLIKAVNRQLFEEDRNFTDLFEELLVAWLAGKGIDPQI